jgi:hypothetical protein
MNQLAKLILEHLDKAGTNMLPDGALFIELRDMPRPPATDLDWKITTGFLEKKGFIAFERDELTDEKMYYITEAGRLVRLRRNPKVSRE